MQGSVKMSLAFLILLVPIVTGFQLGLSCYQYLNSNNEQTSPGAGIQLHHRHTTRPNIVTWVVLDLTYCPQGHNYERANISLEYVDGSDVTRTVRSLPATFQYDQQYDRLMFEPDQPLYTDNVYVTTTDLLTCAGLDITGCAPSAYNCWPSVCYNGGTCLGGDATPQCVCPQGYFGDKCEHHISQLRADLYTFYNEDSGHLYSRNGDFEKHGDIRLESHEANSPVHVTGNGGHAHLQHTHSSWPRSTNFHTASTTSVLSGRDIWHGFTHHGMVQFDHNHNHDHAVHLYTTHYNTDTNYQGASLVYQNHRLHMSVNTGQHRHDMSVHWHPAPNCAHHVTSSFSPQYGVSLHVNGHPLGSMAGRHSAPSYACSHGTSQLCVGSCGYNYATYGSHYSYHHQHPHASYWMSSTHFTNLCLPGLVQNHMLNVLGNIDKLTYQTSPTHSVPPPIPRTTVMSALTTTPTPTAKVPMATAATLAPTTTADYTATVGGPYTAAVTTSSAGPLCYSCSKVSTDGACTSMTACQSNEVCAVFQDPTGYTHECLPKTTCNMAKALTHSKCWICCDVSLCNKRCAPAITCLDSANCGVLKTTGYDVCSDPKLAASDCKKSCGLC